MTVSRQRNNVFFRYRGNCFIARIAFAKFSQRGAIFFTTTPSAPTTSRYGIHVGGNDIVCSIGFRPVEIIQSSGIKNVIEPRINSA